MERVYFGDIATGEFALIGVSSGTFPLIGSSSVAGSQALSTALTVLWALVDSPKVDSMGAGLFIV